MTRLIVLDASVALTWCFEDETTEASVRLLDEMKRCAIVVPALWHVELANTLVQGAKRGRINDAAIAEFDRLIRDLRVETDHGVSQSGFGHLVSLARRHGLSAYDATYLELAMRLNATLATHDAALRRAAEAAGIAVIAA